MRCSQLFQETLRQPPAGAEIPSHQLMLRVGLIRGLASGIYSWLPLGLRVLRKVEAIIREELNASGAQEILMPMVHPAELWHQSGRWDAMGPELLRFQDRRQRDYCLAPTHEEVVTDLARNTLFSYRQLPVNLYQIHTKYRDEIRPRFGVMRAREFIMMDAYSFHTNEDSLRETYDEMYHCYGRILDRLGLQYRVVQADSGAIGGQLSHEFQVLADTGEDVLAVSDQGDYAANVETAACLPPAKESGAAESLTKVATPGVRTIAEVCQQMQIPVEKTVKTLIVRGHEQPLVALALRGDHQLNEIKAAKHKAVQAPLQFVEKEEVRKALGVSPGSIGPCGLSLPVIADHGAAVIVNFICGANEDDYHFTGANWGRDAELVDEADLRMIEEGDPTPDGRGSVRLIRGIEVGHIFHLGDKYSQSMQAIVPDEKGQNVAMVMGCYGIGVTRLVAALIEQQHDEKGIIWSPQVAPFQVMLVAINYQKSDQVRSVSDSLYQQLSAGLEVLIDDRNVGAGVKLTDAELIGCPYIVVIGERSLQKKEVELTHRLSGEKAQVAIIDLPGVLGKKLAS